MVYAWSLFQRLGTVLMGAVRHMTSWGTILVFEIVVPFVLASSLEFGYLPLVVAALSHTLALGIVARMHQKISLLAALLLCLCNLATLMHSHSISALYFLLVHAYGY